MSDNTGIEWTDATWNIATGCTRVSPGCDHCYIERTPPFRMAHRKFDGDGVGSTTGVVLYPERLTIPLHWRKPRKVFVNSLSDLFVKDIPDDLIARAWAVMARTPQHTYQVLTKRPARMRSLLSSDLFRRHVYDALVSIDYAWINEHRLTWPLPNVWGGVTAENQAWADRRIPILRDTPLAVRWLSYEPALGPVDLRATSDAWGGYLLDSIDWVVCGGESGPGARPMLLPWAQSLRDQCVTTDVPFLFKQWGEWLPAETLSVGHLSDPRERHGEIVEDGRLPHITWRRIYRRVGKKAAGRKLDGRTWDEYPTTLVGAS